MINHSKWEERFSPAYGREEVCYPRRCVFWGTPNRNDYIKDDTGNRRFLPIRVNQVDIESLKKLIETNYGQRRSTITNKEKNIGYRTPLPNRQTSKPMSALKMNLGLRQSSDCRRTLQKALWSNYAKLCLKILKKAGSPHRWPDDYQRVWYKQGGKEMESILRARKETKCSSWDQKKILQMPVIMRMKTLASSNY